MAMAWPGSWRTEVGDQRVMDEVRYKYASSWRSVEERTKTSTGSGGIRSVPNARKSTQQPPVPPQRPAEHRVSRAVGVTMAPALVMVGTNVSRDSPKGQPCPEASNEGQAECGPVDVFVPFAKLRSVPRTVPRRAGLNLDGAN